MQTIIKLKMSLVASVFAVACATVGPPPELVRARDAYQNAAMGPAAELNPADLHDARVLLASAEDAAKRDPTSAVTLHRAYLAERRAELADAQGRTSQAARDKLAAEQRLQDLKLAQKDRQISSDEQALAATSAAEEQAKQDAARKSQALDSARTNLSQTQAALDTERQARLDAEQKAQTAVEALSNLAAVKEESRGTVITLSGSVLFASGKSTLLPSATRALDEVATAIAPSSRRILIEGHTDSRGSEAFNLALSQARALSVMDYLVSRGIPPGRVRAVGLGPSRPVEDNRTAEGRANNRRVEIILETPQLSSMN